MKIDIVRNILEHNEAKAAELRANFTEQNILVVDIISSPGAGKTSLLEATLNKIVPDLVAGVIEGDCQTINDAQRVAKTGTPVVQINTEGGCHLSSMMVEEACKSLPMDRINLLIIENVGNLVCPAEFDLGEHHKICILSVTEGDDKPEKYPVIFTKSDVLIINKIDLLPYVKFDLENAKKCALRINPALKIFCLSATTGEGVLEWINWLKNARTALVNK